MSEDEAFRNNFVTMVDRGTARIGVCYSRGVKMSTILHCRKYAFDRHYYVDHDAQSTIKQQEVFTRYVNF